MGKNELAGIECLNVLKIEQSTKSISHAMVHLVYVQAKEVHGRVDGLDLVDLAEPELDVLGSFGQDPHPVVDGLTDDGVLGEKEHDDLCQL